MVQDIEGCHQKAKVIAKSHITNYVVEGCFQMAENIREHPKGTRYGKYPREYERISITKYCIFVAHIR